MNLDLVRVVNFEKKLKYRFPDDALRAIDGFVADVDVGLSVTVDLLTVDVVTVPGERVRQIGFGFKRHSADAALNDDAHVNVGQLRCDGRRRQRQRQ